MKTHEARPREQTRREMVLNNISLPLGYWVLPPHIPSSPVSE